MTSNKPTQPSKFKSSSHSKTSQVISFSLPLHPTTHQSSSSSPLLRSHSSSSPSKPKSISPSHSQDLSLHPHTTSLLSPPRSFSRLHPSTSTHSRPSTAPNSPHSPIRFSSNQIKSINHHRLGDLSPSPSPSQITVTPLALLLPQSEVIHPQDHQSNHPLVKLSEVIHHPLSSPSLNSWFKNLSQANFPTLLLISHPILLWLHRTVSTIERITDSTALEPKNPTTHQCGGSTKTVKVWSSTHSRSVIHDLICMIWDLG